MVGQADILLVVPGGAFVVAYESAAVGAEDNPLLATGRRDRRRVVIRVHVVKSELAEPIAQQALGLAAVGSLAGIKLSAEVHRVACWIGCIDHHHMIVKALAAHQKSSNVAVRDSNNRIQEKDALERAKKKADHHWMALPQKNRHGSPRECW